MDDDLPGVVKGSRGRVGVADREGATDAAREADGSVCSEVDGSTIDQPNNAVSIAVSESSCSSVSSKENMLPIVVIEEKVDGAAEDSELL